MKILAIQKDNLRSKNLNMECERYKLQRNPGNKTKGISQVRFSEILKAAEIHHNEAF